MLSQPLGPALFISVHASVAEAEHENIVAPFCSLFIHFRSVAQNLKVEGQTSQVGNMFIPKMYYPNQKESRFHISLKLL